VEQFGIKFYIETTKSQSIHMNQKPENPEGLEHKRENFIREMAAATPREILDAIDAVNNNPPAVPSIWPEFITQTHGACYAS